MSVHLRQGVVALVAGMIFAVGLALGGMTEPAKVIGFLDVTGEWMPALAFVMMGAILVHGAVWIFIRRRQAPLLAPSFSLPTARDVDPRLLIGSALFGIGWGIGGFCPGPGVVATISGSLPPLVFVASMVAGTWLAIVWERSSSKRPNEGGALRRGRGEGSVQAP